MRLPPLIYTTHGGLRQEPVNDAASPTCRNDRKRSGAMTDSPTYYHGTKADLKLGDLIAPGYASNYGRRKPGNFIYLSATLDAAIWGAELAIGEGRGRIYIVKPTGAIEDDPNLTNKRFPGNPTSPTARGIHFASLARLRSGQVTLPSGSRKCTITSRNSRRAVLN